MRMKKPGDAGSRAKGAIYTCDFSDAWVMQKKDASGLDFWKAGQILPLFDFKYYGDEDYRARATARIPFLVYVFMDKKR